ncbi:CBO0543 family protein [Bacillus sp. JJ1521]|uniref:CBO0543 family protein n=1 Tax=Bacillus sp. JJ1521 TaxID=3122957 RepID=UPI002FFE00BA
MNTVKLLKNSNSQPLPKKPYRFWINPGLIVTILLGTLIGTYLDLFYVGKGYYSFPMRPFPDIFSVHVGFTLVGLPLILVVFLLFCDKLNFVGKIGAVLLLASIMTSGEKLSEGFGWFLHDPEWKHIYSLFGYTIYLSLLLIVYSFFSMKKT